MTFFRPPPKPSGHETIWEGRNEVENYGLIFLELVFLIRPGEEKENHDEYCGEMRQEKGRGWVQGEVR